MKTEVKILWLSPASPLNECFVLWRCKRVNANHLISRKCRTKMIFQMNLRPGSKWMRLYHRVYMGMIWLIFNDSFWDFLLYLVFIINIQKRMMAWQTVWRKQWWKKWWNSTTMISSRIKISAIYILIITSLLLRLVQYKNFTTEKIPVVSYKPYPYPQLCDTGIILWQNSLVFHNFMSILAFAAKSFAPWH